MFKSTILDAYEAYHSVGSSLNIESFHNRDERNRISITGVFTDITDSDIEAIGKEWVLNDDEFGVCAKFKIEWGKANTAGEKYSFSKETSDWKPGGAGGFNSILTSRLPTPIRINPTDTTESLEQIVKDLIAKNAAEKIKTDKSKLARIISEIEVLAKEVESEISEDINSINESIQSEMASLFNGVKVNFETGVGKFEPEKAIKEGSKFILETNGNASPLSN